MNQHHVFHNHSFHFNLPVLSVCPLSYTSHTSQEIGDTPHNGAENEREKPLICLQTFCEALQAYHLKMSQESFRLLSLRASLSI